MFVIPAVGVRAGRPCSSARDCSLWLSSCTWLEEAFLHCLD